MILQRFDSADAIARFLRQAGVKGERGDSTQCAIARYVRQLYPHAAAVTAGMVGVHVWLNVSNKRPSLFEIENTPAMDAFIENFDAGLYPAITRV